MPRGKHETKGFLRTSKLKVVDGSHKTKLFDRMLGFRISPAMAYTLAQLVNWV